MCVGIREYWHYFMLAFMYDGIHHACCINAQFGNSANNAKGNAKAKPKPPIPIDSCMAPPSLDKEPPKREPKIGPVHEKETIASVSAIKKIPMIPPMLLALSSILLLQDCGKVIS